MGVPRRGGCVSMSDMPIVIGVDGCARGWVFVRLEDGARPASSRRRPGPSRLMCRTVRPVGRRRASASMIASPRSSDCTRAVRCMAHPLRHRSGRGSDRRDAADTQPAATCVARNFSPRRPRWLHNARSRCALCDGHCARRRPAALDRTAYSAGACAWKSVTPWYACAMRSTSASANSAPLISRPVGRPSASLPLGTLIEG